MTAKEQAIEYHKLFMTPLLPEVRYRYKIAKEHALILVNHILEKTKEPVLPMGNSLGYDYDDFMLEVKSELEKM